MARHNDSQNTANVVIEGHEITITNPAKILWPEDRITKLDYIGYLLQVAPYLLAYTNNRLLTMIRYPHGIDGKSFFQKEIPDFAPAWVPYAPDGEKNRIILKDQAALVWVANLAALELHVPFDTVSREDYPTDIAIDLDPMDVENFDLVREIALKTKAVLDSFGLVSVPKTSGATGLQIYVPLEPKYTYEEVRLFNEFLARYIAGKNPGQVTLERAVKNRGRLLYFDYLQLWRGRTLPAPYSVRARKGASVSTPLEWKEVDSIITPGDFTIFTLPKRLKDKGDLFAPVSTGGVKQNIDGIMAEIKGKMVRT